MVARHTPPFKQIAPIFVLFLSSDVIAATMAYMSDIVAGLPYRPHLQEECSLFVNGLYGNKYGTLYLIIFEALHTNP